MMKQILQNLSTGETLMVEVPDPQVLPGTVKIQSTASLISAGTERMLVDFGRAGWLEKARQQPEKVRQVLAKVQTDGLLPTMEAVRSKLEKPITLGYSNAGIVTAVGEGVRGYRIGDRVVSNGPHAEVIVVPQNLCSRIPNNVSDEEASFAVLGAIALQGVRLITPTLGECFAVTGLGLVGLLAVQLLRAHGCRVLGIDLDPSKIELARRLGAETVDLSNGEDPLLAARHFSRGRGLDGVVLALTSPSNKPVSEAAQMCRKRGRVVLVGVTGLELRRADFYEKEIKFQVSCSYGPGRYDPLYEEHGQDYPVGFVRWTEQRNFEAVLDMMAAGVLNVELLTSHRFPVDQALQAYELLGSEEPHLGIVLDYKKDHAEPPPGQERIAPLKSELRESRPGEVSLGVIGAGNYATRVLIGAFSATDVRLQAIASAGGVNAAVAGWKFGFSEVGSDPNSVIENNEVNTIIIATRHDSHASLALRALEAGKNVFVEKPLALSIEGLEPIEAMGNHGLGKGTMPLLMVGFNRRFSPLVRKMKRILETVKGPKTFIVTVNAGAIESSHWIQNSKVGGGRIAGEACHFIDLLRHLAGSPIRKIVVTTLKPSTSVDTGEDKASITLKFADGSHGTVHYFANGHRAFPKERIEIFCEGRILQLDNFRRLKGYGWPRFKRTALWRQDKGQRACAAAFVDAVRVGGPAPISFEELIEVSRFSIEAAELARGSSRRSSTN